MYCFEADNSEKNKSASSQAINSKAQMKHSISWFEIGHF